jgi:hypothetical protein
MPHRIPERNKLSGQDALNICQDIKMSSTSVKSSDDSEFIAILV